MAEESRINKISLSVLVIAVICWLGGINVRALIGFDILQVGTLDFKPNVHPYVEREIYTLLVSLLKNDPSAVSGARLASDERCTVLYFYAGRNLYIGTRF